MFVWIMDGFGDFFVSHVLLEHCVFFLAYLNQECSVGFYFEKQGATSMCFYSSCPSGFQMHLGLFFIQFMVMGNCRKLFAAVLLSKVAFM